MAPAKLGIAILASGRGSNMEAILRSVREGALSGLCEVALVFSDNPAALALETARTQGIATACVDGRGKRRAELDAALLDALAPVRVDYLVLAGYMRILSPVVVRRFPGRIVNIHPADTREHRGLHGYAWAFGRQLETTRVTVHLVDEGLDTGPVLAQREVDLRGATTVDEVERRGLAVEHALYAEALADLFRRHEWSKTR
jgi:phosphoribosylglycinamide formyltransferase-1